MDHSLTLLESDVGSFRFSEPDTVFECNLKKNSVFTHSRGCDKFCVYFFDLRDLE